jgi:hypothetical protein
MARTIHVCQSVRGALRQPLHELDWFQHDDGRPMTPSEAFDALCDELVKGHEVIPLGSPCEGFDYVKGCPGHPTPDGATDANGDGRG